MKANIDGYYESMRVGTADNLTPRGDASEEIIMSRTAGGSNAIEAGTALIKAIKGYSLVSNNRYRSYASESNGYIIRAEHDGVYISGESTNMAYIQLSNIVALKKDHRYLSIIVGEGELIGLFNDGSQQFISGNAVYTCAADEKSYYQLRVNAAGVRLDTRVKIMLIDLTQMFFTGNEPATAEEFAHRLGYDSIEQMPYLPYNEGEIISSKAEGVRTTDAEGDSSERSWGTTLHKYFPAGLKSAGNVYDEITPAKTFKRIDAVKMKDLSWVLENAEFRTFSAKIADMMSVNNTNDRQDGIVCNRYIISNKPNLGQLQQDISILRVGQYVYVKDSRYSDAETFVNHFSYDDVIYYELATPEEYTYDDLNLSMRVVPGGKEEAIIPEGVMSAPLRMDVVYSIDAYATVVGNKQHIGNLSSLQTSTKTDLVSAVNETHQLAKDSYPTGGYLANLYQSGGAMYDRAKKLWMLNGIELTDEDIAIAYNDSLGLNSKRLDECCYGSLMKTNFPSLLQGSFGSLTAIACFANCPALEIVKLNNLTVCYFASIAYMFIRCKSLRTVSPIIDVTNCTVKGNVIDAFQSCSNLKNVKLRGLNIDISLSDSPLLTVEDAIDSSLGYLVANTSNVRPIMITLHADAYARVPETLKSKAQAKQISIVSA